MIGDRLIRSMAARFLWGGLVVLCLIGLYVTSREKTAALNTQIADAEARATSYAKTTVSDLAIVDTRANTITFDKKSFEIAIQGDVFTDPTVARLRVWDADGLLLASTDPSEAVGQRISSDPLLTDVQVSGSPKNQIVDDSFTYSTVGSPRTPTTLLEVFTPFLVKDQVDPVGAVQVDFLYSQLQVAAASPWDTWMRVLLFVGVLSAVLFVISLVLPPLPRRQRPIALSPETAPVAVAAPAPRARADNNQLEEELQIAREQLRQASEAFAFLEAKMKEVGGQASSVDVDAAMARISELETALQRAEHDAEEARTLSQDDLARIQREADERVAEMERLMREEAAKADPELEALRAKLADAEARAQSAEAALDAARADVAAAKQEVEEAPETTSMNLLEELEAKVAEAEARAKEAEEEALRVTPEATDLRAKLAQAAARKRLGSSSG